MKNLRVDDKISRKKTWMKLVLPAPSRGEPCYQAILPSWASSFWSWVSESRAAADAALSVQDRSAGRVESEQWVQQPVAAEDLRPEDPEVAEEAADPVVAVEEARNRVAVVEEVVLLDHES